ncbi:MAG: hypothetical protein MUF80_07130, partial [Burkholderiales bacterium]|nr:hypothetical protein [Burkholderiales bacterium]
CGEEHDDEKQGTRAKPGHVVHLTHHLREQGVIVFCLLRPVEIVGRPSAVKHSKIHELKEGS